MTGPFQIEPLPVLATDAGGPRFLAFTDDADVPLKLANQVPEPTTFGLLAISSP